MAVTSTDPALGTPMPAFALPDPDGVVTDSASLAGRPVLVLFICNHCPYVKHVRAALADIGRDYGERVGIVAINPNDAEAYPDDSPEAMRAEIAAHGYPFPYLVDADGAVAAAFGAVCTPDPFLYDATGRLFYRGQVDDTRPSGDEAATGIDLRQALDAVLADGAPPDPQHPSVGCSIKWKPGAA